MSLCVLLCSILFKDFNTSWFFADEEEDTRSKVPVPRCHFVRERTPASQVSGEKNSLIFIICMNNQTYLNLNLAA